MGGVALWGWVGFWFLCVGYGGLIVGCVGFVGGMGVFSAVIWYVIVDYVVYGRLLYSSVMCRCLYR